MPYSSRFTGRRRKFTARPRFGRKYGGTFRRSSYMGRYQSGGIRSLARRVGRLANRVGSPEVKYFDTAISDNGAGGLNPAVSITDICQIPALDAPGVLNATARDGDKVTLRSIQISGYCQANWVSGNINGAVACRLVLYRDTQSLTSIPAPTNILEAFPPLAIPGTTSLRNMTMRNRFLILHDQRVNISQNGNSVFAINKYLKVQDNLVFESDTTGIPTANTYGIMLINDQGTGTITGSSVNWYIQTRLRFTDN